jgi:hypothetical protein
MYYYLSNAHTSLENQPVIFMLYAYLTTLYGCHRGPGPDGEKVKRSKSSKKESGGGAGAGGTRKWKTKEIKDLEEKLMQWGPGCWPTARRRVSLAVYTSNIPEATQLPRAYNSLQSMNPAVAQWFGFHVTAVFAELLCHSTCSSCWRVASTHIAWLGS